jgi:hypothetical protein
MPESTAQPQHQPTPITADVTATPAELQARAAADYAAQHPAEPDAPAADRFSIVIDELGDDD